MVEHPSSLLNSASAAQYQAVHRTALGQLYQGDCLPWLRDLPDESVDFVFADPPFNLGKES
ncbi:MAG TPA: hypothetical protein VKY74_24600 [Chloroflexia bacterium]|nr:hypothetical protein [Chloroflexia bacterium]